MLLATFFFAVMQVLVKTVPHIPAIEIILFRSVISFAISYIILRRKKVNKWGNNKKLLMARGFVGAVALILFFLTLQKIPLASAVSLNFLAPIFTSLLGIYIVRERFSPFQVIFFIISFLGVLIIKNYDPRVPNLYLIAGVLGSLFAGIAYNLIRKMGHSEHPLVTVLYFPLVTTPIAAAYCLFNWVQPAGWDWLILIAIGLFTQFAQYFMTMSYQSEELSNVASLKYLGIIYALVFDYVFFGEVFNFMTYCGMALIILGVILNYFYKQGMLQYIFKYRN